MTDYTNQKFGSLTALSVCGRVKHGPNYVKAWTCKCDCGRTLEVTQDQLLKGQVLACKVCRRGPCVICGADITDESFGVKRQTCSEACKKEQARRRARKRYAKLTREDPEHNKKRWKQRTTEDPEYNKKRYQRTQELINNKSPEEKKIIQAKANKASSEWRSNWVIKAKESNPEAYEEFRVRTRRSGRKHYAKKSLSKLFDVSEKLKEKDNE